MRAFRSWFSRGGLWAALAGICVVCSPMQPLTARQGKNNPPKEAHVYVYPDKLTDKDKLADGNTGRMIDIKAETMLVWVDLMPDARFAHDTEYVLISSEGTRVVKGQWWPTLNGKDLFRDGKTYKV